MEEEILNIIITFLLTLIGTFASYHIAIKQGIFNKNSLYVNIITPFFKGNFKPLKTNLVIFGIRSPNVTSNSLLYLPLILENKSKESLKKIRVAIANDEMLESKWARDTISKENNEKWGIDKEYIINNYLITEYKIDLIRIDESVSISHLISLDTDHINKCCEKSRIIQNKLSQNTGYKTYLTSVRVFITAENIKAINYETTLIIAIYNDELDFLNKQCKELADEYFKNTITLNPKEHLNRYLSQKVDKGISKRIFVNMPKFEQLQNEYSVFLENFDDPNYLWWEKKYKVISPFKLIKFKSNKSEKNRIFI